LFQPFFQRAQVISGR